MPIFRRLKGLDWPALVVELILIFVGITAALWFDNLSQARADRRLEAEILSELVVALQSDTADLNFNLRSSARTAAAIDSIMAYMAEQRPYDEAMAEHFARSSVHTNFYVNLAAYQFLNAVGLDVIRDDSLRIDLTQYYEVNVRYLAGIEQDLVNENWNGTLRPKMVELFSYEYLYGPAVPHDYPALIRDREFRSILTTTRGLLRFKDTRTRAALEHAERLLQRVEAEPSKGRSARTE